MRRIEIIDALRGFALLLILLIRAYNNFSIYASVEDPLINTDRFDKLIDSFIFYFVKDKAFAIFSIMFGISFSILLKRNAERDVDFNLLFTKRLLLLLILGYLHAIIYRGDILTKYAILGFPLLLINRLNNRWLISISLIFLLQLTYLIPLIFNIPKLHLGPSGEAATNILAKMNSISTEGNLIDLIKFNITTGVWDNWRGNINVGRIPMIFGYFLLGLYLGRIRLFENIKSYLPKIKQTLAIAIIVYLILIVIQSYGLRALNISNERVALTYKVLNGYSNSVMMIIIFTGFILLYQIKIFEIFSRIFIPYGKMSLTSYVFQGIIGMILFYNFGFGLYQYTTPTLSIIAALIIFTAQFIFAYLWFRYFRHGPLEYIWRSLTIGSFRQPMIKQTES